MTDEERKTLEEQYEKLQSELRQEKKEKWLTDARSNEAKYLGRYFLDEKSGALYHPVCVLTPECPYQLWCVVINPAPAYSYKPNMHKMYFGPEDRYSYWLYYNPMYCKRVFHAYFTHMRELTQEEFDVAAKAAFMQMWEQVHDSFTLDNFKEKVTHYYDAVSHLA